MAKKIISDMITTKRSIRQIPISSEMKKKIEKVITTLPEQKRRQANWQRKPLNPKFMIWLIAVLCIMALFFGISIIFSSVTVLITPRTEVVTFADDKYTAKLNSQNIADLSFEILNIKQASSEIVSATEEQEVTQKASGKIIVYNNYSTVSQRLINNTRFEANNGKIYRINSSIVVPGQKTFDGKVVPGSIEVTVYADEAGESYNLPIADLTGDFKIPGFKGDPRYAGFYAMLKTDITGGLVGKQRIVSADIREEAENNIKEKLREQLLKELYAVKPENYSIFNNGYSINYTSQNDLPVDKDKIQIGLDASLNAVVFNNIKLAKYVANKKIDDFDNLSVEFIPAENLIIVFTTEDNAELWTSDNLGVSLSGDATIKWLYDDASIKKDLAGKKEADLRTLVAKYKNSVLNMRVIFRPVWTRYFPDNLNKIIIKEDVPE